MGTVTGRRGSLHLRRTLVRTLALVLALAHGGGVTAAFAGARSVTWTSREDFEGNAPGEPGPTIRLNVDSASQPGVVTLAATREGPGERAGQPVLLAKGVKFSLAPAVAAGGKGGGYLALWLEARGAGQPTVIARTLDAAAKPLGKPVALGNGAARQSAPCAASDDRSGNYLAVWMDGRNSAPAIYARRISSAGAPVGNDVVLSEIGPNNEDPAVAWNPAAREYLVAWSVAGADILARRVGERGAPTGPVIRVCAEPGPQRLPRVVHRAATGDYLVCWVDRRAGNDDIFCRPVGADGSLAAPEAAVRAEAFSEVLSDLVVNGRDAELLLLWEDYRHVMPPKRERTIGEGVVRPLVPLVPLGNEVDLYAQRLDRDVAPLGPEIPVCEVGANQLKARGAFVPAARQYLIVWQDGRDGYEDWDVVGRLAGADGRLGAEFEVAGQPREQFASGVACQGQASECLVSWYGAGEERYDVGLQRLVPARPGAAGVLGGIRLAAADGARWTTLSWSADAPPGTGVAFRTRSAASRAELARAPWSPELRRPGAAIESPPGAWLEVEVRLESTDGKAAPALHEFSVHVEE